MTRTIVAQAINRLWETYGAGSLEKNAAAQYFYELRKPSLDVEAFGEDFCKLASTIGKDPWRLALDIYDNYSFLEKQSGASAKFCVDWSKGLIKKAKLPSYLRGLQHRQTPLMKITGALPGEIFSRARLSSNPMKGLDIHNYMMDRVNAASRGAETKRILKRHPLAAGISRDSGQQIRQYSRGTLANLLEKTSAMAPEVLKQTLKASRAARSTAGMPVRNIPTPEGMASQRAQATVQRATQGRALAQQQAQSAGTNVQGLRTQRRLAKSKLPPKPVATAPVQTQTLQAARPQTAQQTPQAGNWTNRAIGATAVGVPAAGYMAFSGSQPQQPVQGY